MKELISFIIISSTGCGALLGGTVNAIDSVRYRNAISNPGFYYLVDDAGNSVSQKIK